MRLEGTTRRRDASRKESSTKGGAVTRFGVKNLDWVSQDGIRGGVMGLGRRKDARGEEGRREGSSSSRGGGRLDLLASRRGTDLGSGRPAANELVDPCLQVVQRGRENAQRNGHYRKFVSVTWGMTRAYARASRIARPDRGGSHPRPWVG